MSENNCLICREKLVYKQNYFNANCFYCEKKVETNVICKNNHFVCDECHSKQGIDLINEFCEKTELKDPLELAELLMKNTKIKMHGPEHHFLVPAVLLTSYYNLKKDKDKKIKKLKIAYKRSKDVLGGFCGYYGACGAAIGTGIFMSIITESTPIKKEEWKLSNLITARTLLRIANNGGPRCCKRNTYLAIIEAVNFVKENLNVEIPIRKEIYCIFNNYNEQCIKDDCPFYLLNKKEKA